MNSKELLQLKLKRDAFIEQYVAARMKWISMGVTPILDVCVHQYQNQSVRNRNSVQKEDFVTLYERVDTRTIKVGV